MPKSLVIVESPAKAKTISKILGKNFVVKASAGHIRDLPQKEIGVDIDKNFAPKYVIIPKKEDVVRELQGAARDAEHIYLAPDPDREGEAIAWHLAQILEIPVERLQRIEFHEITSQAVQNAVAHPRTIDINRVDAQQARRILDRLVGYKLSPLLWKKVQRGLSAGRVQSVAVRLLCDREKEIQAFVSEEYWTIHGQFRQATEGAAPFVADLVRWAGKKPELGDEAAARAVVTALAGAECTVESVKTRERSRDPQPPFITSTLQREAASALNLTVKRTMAIAQQLYEGIDLDEEGPVGLITYMRTDSTRVAEEAQEATREFILASYGRDYYPARRRQYGARKGAQDAHECIRPTDVNRTPDRVKKSLTPDQYKLYRLIWQRFVASQMAASTIETRTVEIGARLNGRRSDGLFRLSTSRVLFDGYTRVYEEAREEGAPEEGEASSAPVLEEGEKLVLLAVEPRQHFTQPPPRFSEATLVKALEEQGIGRPSTYAPTIGTIQERGYVQKEGRTLIPTDLGMKVNEQLVHHFPSIVDTEFTAQMEAKLDEVEKGSQTWTKLLDDFYQPFLETLKAANEEMKRVVIVTDYLCEQCGRPLLSRYGRFGNFLGCSGYPDCNFTHQLTRDNKPVPKDRPAVGIACRYCAHEPLTIKYGPYGEYLKCANCGKNQPKSTGVTCPKCHQGSIVEKRSRMGKTFYGCDRYPDCDFVLWSRPLDKPACPECGSILVHKPRKRGDDLVACSQCKFTAPASEMLPEEAAEVVEQAG
jgi:DNA topoisomerase-1